LVYCTAPISKMFRCSTMIRASRMTGAEVASPWGSETWRVDRTAFLNFCRAASKPEPSKAKREWSGFLSLAYADVDASKSGQITAAQFDMLCEHVAVLPRRFGLAPTAEVEYGGSIEKRIAARKAMFDKIDTMHGPARGWIGPAQFIRWATEHVAAKVATNVEAASATGKMVDFYHIDNYDKDDFVRAIKVAVSDKKSPEFARLYEFLLAIFVEEDVECQGVVTLEQFGRLVNRAAVVPREFGLAPPTASEERIAELYKSMEDSRWKGVTFRKFLQWSVQHLEKKVA
jgi:hypothetical protein